MLELTDSRVAFGVTTAPRAQSTLMECCDSYERAGLKPVVFCEPQDPPAVTQFEEIHYPERMGHYRSWLFAAKWLLKNTDADFICIGEDDAVIHPETWEFIQAFGSPGSVLSLFSTVREMETRGLGVFPVSRGDKFAGALALIFYRDDLAKLLRSSIVKGWPDRRPEIPIELLNWVDIMIGNWAKANDINILEPNPSICEHIGATSTLGHGDKITPARRAWKPLKHERGLPWDRYGRVRGQFSCRVNKSCCPEEMAIVRAAGMSVLCESSEVPPDTKRGDIVHVTPIGQQ